MKLTNLWRNIVWNNFIFVGLQIIYFFLMIFGAMRLSGVFPGFGGIYLQLLLIPVFFLAFSIIRKRDFQSLQNFKEKIFYSYFSSLLLIVFWLLLIIGFRMEKINLLIYLSIVFGFPLLTVIGICLMEWRNK